MFKELTKRAMIVCAAVAVIVFGFSATAQAADAKLLLSDRDGNQLGYMVHLDPEPDRFSVCDTQRDGVLLIGRVFDGVDQIATITDGDDAGCDTKSVPILAGHDTWMSLCWDGRVCVSMRIRE
jgi:hypothetical protein